jgi:hypothetical protein
MPTAAINPSTSTVNVNAGTLNHASGSGSTAGTLNVASGATFKRDGGFTNSGLITGAGTIDVGTGTLTNQGTLAPGGLGVAGRITVLGHATLAASSRLDIDIGGTLAAGGYDVLDVSGSLALGGTLGAIAVVAHHEFVLAIIGGLFVIEALSVIIQVFWFKRTGKRIFRMAPIHHHFEQLGWSEPTVVIRFWIVAFVLALAGLSTLKLR